ncbi:hypothetical protein SAMN04489806_1914 [Paramicrobacterium humi]|uniref:Glycosyltransferase 2-like domain-containing protein n=1 Tax=Paramicrobacterium humi TaxID=640635 RepID=A0A1H4MM94_9MICO|nr:glycosyltransferase family 2 protein [Microbacterium humi]SEB83967.1 hypothetical protein SAMN04489806_1914 [Microbacterium humi]
MNDNCHVVVILNWYGRDDTVACVESVLYGSPDVTVLVVDNGSFDGALGEVSDLERVQTLQLPHNLGFAGGMNRGLAFALEAGATMVTILNNDTLIPPGAMRVLHRHAESGAAVSPTVMYRDDPTRVWFGGGAIDMPDGYPHHIAPQELQGCVDGVRETSVLAGCCITATSDTWRRVGLFDERFFLNFEDSEWSLRARAAGVRLGVACDARIFHAVSASFRGAASTLGTYYFLRNGLLFTRIAGAGTTARMRFIRRFSPLRRRQLGVRDVIRGGIVAGFAIGSYLLGRFGEAPPFLQRRAREWAVESSGDLALER